MFIKMSGLEKNLSDENWDEDLDLDLDDEDPWKSEVQKVESNTESDDSWLDNWPYDLPGARPISEGSFLVSILFSFLA